MNKRSLLNEIKEGFKLAGKLVAVAAVVVVLGLASFNVANRISDSTNSLKRVTKLAEKAMIRYNILGFGTCSAVVVAPDLAITAAHCLPKPEQILSLLFQNQLTFNVPILERNKKALAVVFVYEINDLAIITGDFSDKVPVKVDDYAGKIFNEKTAYICGFPGFNEKIRCELQTKLENGLGFKALHSGTAIRGQSGGGVFTKNMELIGIISVVTNEGKTGSASVTGLLSTAKVRTQQK